MRRRFKSVKVLVETIGNVDYPTLLEIAGKHGLSADQVFDQLQECLAQETLACWKPFNGKVIYQPAASAKQRKEYKEKKKALSTTVVSEDMKRVMQEWIEEEKSNHSKFQVSDLLEGLSDSKWYHDGDDEEAEGKPWEEVHVKATLNKLVEDGTVIRREKSDGQKGPDWYWHRSWNEVESKRWKKKKSGKKS